MSIRFYQPGDYDNTILRKILENQAAIIAGTETMATSGGGGGSFSGQTGSRDLGSGDDTGTVTFSSAFSSTPVVTASILMPNANGAVIAVGIHTVTTTGFHFSLSGPTPDANHKLKYIAI